MKKYVKKIISTVIATAAALAVCGATSAFALSDGTYTVSTTTSYKNPETGKVDDGGTGNAELGEAMSRSVVGEKALVEKKGGNTSVTMKMMLYSNISNIRIAVQSSAKGAYNNAQISVVKESSSTDSADIKFAVPNVSANIKTTIYVKPMGRDVCFYWKCDESSAVSGNANFNASASSEKTAGGKLSDIKGHWAEKDIRAVVDKGLFSGTTEVTFTPDKTMTRGMFVTVLGRMSGEKISGKSSFKDVNNGQYYAPYIAWASKNGIVSGTSKTTFNPEAPVTREQAAVILVKYAKYKGVSLQNKSISPSLTGVSAWAKNDVASAGKAGVITKQNTGGYKYTASATRAEVASMVNNFITYYGK